MGACRSVITRLDVNSHTPLLTRTLPVNLPDLILTLLTLALSGAPACKIFPTMQPPAPHSFVKLRAPTSAPGDARMGQLWLDALAAERGAAARTLQTYRDDLAMAALQLTAGT